MSVAHTRECVDEELVSLPRFESRDVDDACLIVDAEFTAHRGSAAQGILGALRTPFAWERLGMLLASPAQKWLSAISMSGW